MLDLVGRGERIRTSDLTVPNRALYQAEPRPDIFADQKVVVSILLTTTRNAWWIIGNGVGGVKLG